MALLILAVQNIPRVIDKKAAQELLHDKIAWSGDRVIDEVQHFAVKNHTLPKNAGELAQMMDGWLPMNPLTEQPVEFLDTNEDGVLRPGSLIVSRAGNIGYYVQGQRGIVMVMNERGVVFRRHTFVPSRDSSMLAQAALR